MKHTFLLLFFLVGPTFINAHSNPKICERFVGVKGSFPESSVHEPEEPPIDAVDQVTNHDLIRLSDPPRQAPITKPHLNPHFAVNVLEPVHHFGHWSPGHAIHHNHFQHYPPLHHRIPMLLGKIHQKMKPFLTINTNDEPLNFGKIPAIAENDNLIDPSSIVHLKPSPTHTFSAIPTTTNITISWNCNDPPFPIASSHPQVSVKTVASQSLLQASPEIHSKIEILTQDLFYPIALFAFVLIIIPRTVQLMQNRENSKRNHYAPNIYGAGGKFRFLGRFNQDACCI